MSSDARIKALWGTLLLVCLVLAYFALLAPGTPDGAEERAHPSSAPPEVPNLALRGHPDTTGGRHNRDPSAPEFPTVEATREATRFRVSGVVLDANGRPVGAGIHIGAGYAERAESATLGITDADGRFQLEGGPAAYRPSALLVEAWDMERGLKSRPHAFDLEGPQALEGECVLRLAAALRLRLHATDGGGSVVPNAVFFVRRTGAARALTAGELAAAYVQHALVDADENGVAEAVVQPGAFWIYARAPEGPYGSGVRRLLPEGGLVTVDPVVVGRETATLDLRVESATGEPVPHAWVAFPPALHHLVALAKEGDAAPPPPGPEVEAFYDLFLWSDAQGRLRVEGLEAGPDPLRLAVGSLHHSPAHVVVDRSASKAEPQRVVLHARPTLTLSFSPTLPAESGLLERVTHVAAPQDRIFADLPDGDPLNDLLLALGDPRTTIDPAAGELLLEVPTPARYEIRGTLPGGWSFHRDVTLGRGEHVREVIALPSGSLRHVQLPAAPSDLEGADPIRELELRLVLHADAPRDARGGPATALRPWTVLAEVGGPAVPIWVPDEAPLVAIEGATTLDGVPGLPVRLSIPRGSGALLRVPLDWSSTGTLEVSWSAYDGTATGALREVHVFGVPSASAFLGPRESRLGGICTLTPNPDGVARVRLPPGTYDVEALTRDGSRDLQRGIVVSAGGTTVVKGPSR